MIALTREVSPAIVRCELTHLDRQPISLAVARAQHLSYEQALTEAGCAVSRLATDESMADSVFIEDIACVFDELAIVTRPGAVSRRAEIAGVEEALGAYRSVRRIEPPATIDGGDVLVAGRRVFVGLSSRTNREAVDQMRRYLEAFDYHVTSLEVRGCLHLKSAVTAIDRETLLLNSRWVDAACFPDFDVIEVDSSEPEAANVVTIDETTICAAAFPRTRKKLDARGVRTVAVDVGEIAKAEGAVTCCSLIFESRSRSRS